MARLKLLSTRPVHLAERLTQPLASAGLEVTNIPLLELKPLALTPAQKSWLLDLDNFDVVIVVSPSAVEILMDELTNYWPQWPVAQSWFTVGAGSSLSLDSYGIQATYPTTGDTSEDLLQLAELHNCANKKVLLVKGEGGRDVIFNALTAQGAAVSVLPMYTRVIPALSAEQLNTMFHGEHQAVILTSAAALENYANLATQNLVSELALEQLKHTIQLLLPSHRVEKIAQELGFKNTINTQGAGAEAILAAISQIKI